MRGHVRRVIISPDGDTRVIPSGPATARLESWQPLWHAFAIYVCEPSQTVWFLENFRPSVNQFGVIK